MLVLWLISVCGVWNNNTDHCLAIIVFVIKLFGNMHVRAVSQASTDFQFCTGSLLCCQWVNLPITDVSSHLDNQLTGNLRVALSVKYVGASG